jgi:hypothetical protein
VRGNQGRTNVPDSFVNTFYGLGARCEIERGEQNTALDGAKERN